MILPAVFFIVGFSMAFIFFCALVLYRRLKFEFSQGEPGALPPAAVIVPCKEDSERLSDNIRSVLNQDYPGRLEFLFVVASRRCPAYAKLARILSEHPDHRARLLVSDAKPVRCSEKVLNQLHGLEHAAPDSEIFLFADSDISVTPDWAKWLAAGLKDPATGLTTTMMLYIPTESTLWSLLRMLWIAQGLPFRTFLTTACGQSMAVRKADFLRLRVADRWKRCLSEDGTIAGAIKAGGLKIRYVARLLPISLAKSDRKDVYRVYNNWFLYSRVYYPINWAIMAISMSWKIWILLWGLKHSLWALLLLEFGGDILYTWVVLSILRRFHDERFREISPSFKSYRFCGAAAAPLILLIYAVNVLNSLVTRDAEWGGYTYRLHGPLDVEVLKEFPVELEPAQRTAEPPVRPIC